jgi:sec-independent protein translocase protein TatB
VLIMGLALLVLGPEKLPGLAEKVGRWTGRARAMARQLRTQLEQEVNLEEMARSRPMQAPPYTGSTTPPNTPDASATTPAEPAAGDPTASTQPPPAASDQPHNPSGLDVQTMVSGMEPPPQSAAETPADKPVRDAAVQ